MTLSIAILAWTLAAAEPAPAMPPPPVAKQPAVLKFDRPCHWQEGPSDPHTTRTPPHSIEGLPLQQPAYPPLSRRLNEEGRAIMLLLVNEHGEVAEARIEGSTGYERLDLAALQVTDQWRFAAATLNDKPVCAWGRFAVSFKLTEENSESDLGGLIAKQLVQEAMAEKSSLDSERVVGKFLCYRIALTDALVRGMQKRGMGDYAVLPSEFKAAAPELLKQMKPHCDCAGPDFNVLASTGVVGNPLDLSKSLVASGKCPGPAAPTW